MKINTIIIITAILNFIVASIKLVAGLLFSFTTLIADSIQSFIDFFTDITSLAAYKIGNRRANKTYPFGYGQVHYLSNILTGILLFFIGVFVLVQVFISNSEFKSNIIIFIILVVVLLLKGIVIKLLHQKGNNKASELLIESYKESKTDFISTCIVIIVLLLSFLERYLPGFINIDKIGSCGMAIYIFYTSIKMIISNIHGILINDEENEEIKEEILKAFEKKQKIKIISTKIIRMANYFSVFLQLDVDNNLTINEYIKIEKEIKKKLKSIDNRIRFIDIEPL